MDKRHPTAALAHAFRQESRKKLAVWAGVWVFVWGLLIGVDWTLRIVHFGWHREVVSPRGGEEVGERGKPALDTVQVPEGVDEGGRTEDFAETCGGNRRGGLTDFLPAPILREPYEEWHDSYTIWRDAAGYETQPGSVVQKRRVVVVGDSFLLTGNGHLFSWELEEASGVGVLNRGRFAAGPFQELKKYIQNVPRSQWCPVIVWEIAGREAGRDLFRRQPYRDWFHNNQTPSSSTSISSVASRCVHWEALTPSLLDRQLPSTSVLAYFSRKLWSWFRLEALGEWPPEILGVQEGRFGPTLFYGENLKILPHLTVEEQGEGVLSVIDGIARGFREAGTELVVLLVPEKEQVWVDDLPEDMRDGIEASADLLRWLEREGRKRGIRIVNPLETFRRMTREGIALYWRGDTHWNGEGMRVAAELTAAELRAIPECREDAE